MAAEKPRQKKGPRKPIEWSKFLAEIPPYTNKFVLNLSTSHRQRYESNIYKTTTPTIEIHCDSSKCNGIRFFDSPTDSMIVNFGWKSIFLTYVCRLCRSTVKTFAVTVRRRADNTSGEAIKMGELPSFGPPVLTRLNEILGEDRELFFKGRRAESQGMGIGAFAYYRRVVENQKDSLIDQIIKVAKRTNSPEGMVKMLESAKNETQFTRAIEIIKDAIPETLKIIGENPLTLLHRPLSGGLHDWSEDECLDEAASIRIVLTDLCEKMGQALKEQTELDEAVKRLKSPREKK